MTFMVTEGDKMYTITNFPEYLQEQLEEDIDTKQNTYLNYDE